MFKYRIQHVANSQNIYAYIHIYTSYIYVVYSKLGSTPPVSFIVSPVEDDLVFFGGQETREEQSRTATSEIGTPRSRYPGLVFYFFACLVCLFVSRTAARGAQFDTCSYTYIQIVYDTEQQIQTRQYRTYAIVDMGN